MKGNNQKHTVNGQNPTPFEICTVEYYELMQDFFQWYWHQVSDKVFPEDIYVREKKRLFRSLPQATQRDGIIRIWHEMALCLKICEPQQIPKWTTRNYPNEFLGERGGGLIHCDNIPTYHAILAHSANGQPLNFCGLHILIYNGKNKV